MVLSVVLGQRQSLPAAHVIKQLLSVMVWLVQELHVKVKESEVHLSHSLVHLAIFRFLTSAIENMGICHCDISAL